MKKHIFSVVLSVVVAWIPLALFVMVSRPLPAIAPGLFWMVPLGVFAGFTLLWRKYPRNAYPIGLLYVPTVGAALLWAALQVSWYVVGDYL